MSIEYFIGNPFFSSGENRSAEQIRDRTETTPDRTRRHRIILFGGAHKEISPGLGLSRSPEFRSGQASAAKRAAAHGASPCIPGAAARPGAGAAGPMTRRRTSF